MGKIEKDPITGQYTTGHQWNGIRELRTPVPTWWMLVWIASIAFAVVYVFLLPSIPLGDRTTAGATGYTARLTLEARLEDVRAEREAQGALLADVELADIAADPELSVLAFNGGRSAFGVNCIQCHGAGGGGQIGQFPSLIDDDWLWGGTLDDIWFSITHGIRNETLDARFSLMPAYGDFYEQDDIGHLADYVLALNPSSAEHATRDQLPGHEIYQLECTACHGENGLGDPIFGAPNLSDAVWLYGGEREELVAQITNPQMGVMPAFGERLDEATIKMLTIYVHSLGGGEGSEAETASLD
ncbi:MAG: cytochrome-c oxidase, cbb3-type subunit III [Devosiaceae bacterium]|nr:cytochrome-c oxidase, cbb3-type subunit III [Devosiaceae bacterium MH13]